MAMSREEKEAFEKMQTQLNSTLRDLDDLKSKFYLFTRGVENNSAYFLFNSGNPNFRIRIPSLSGDPSTGEEGAIAVVGGILKVYTSGAWVVVGTQT